VEKAEEREDMLINKSLSEKNKKRGEFITGLFKFYWWLEILSLN
jgi:hypothetical protein